MDYYNWTPLKFVESLYTGGSTDNEEWQTL